MKQIACFLTCGYTESGAMQAFLRGINSNYEYKQWIPNKTRKRKGSNKNLSASLCGLTGESLLEKVCTVITAHRDEIIKCSAIIYEDDLDGHFNNYSQDRINQEMLAIKQQLICATGQDIPIFIIFASPEVESWFIADWDNGFGYLYGKSETLKELGTVNIRKWFATNLRKYIQEEVLKQYKYCIEDYGYFDGTYLKLSNEIIITLQERIVNWLNEFPSSKGNLSQINITQLRYSKRLHGDEMLRNVNAGIIAEKCTKYFCPVYYALKAFL